MNKISALALLLLAIACGPAPSPSGGTDAGAQPLNEDTTETDAGEPLPMATLDAGTLDAGTTLPTAKELCEGSATSVCHKLHTCGDAAKKTQFGSSFGPDEATCITNQKKTCQMLPPDDALCGTKKFDFPGAAQGLKNYDALSCADWNALDLNSQRYIGDYCK